MNEIGLILVYVGGLCVVASVSYAIGHATGRVERAAGRLREVLRASDIYATVHMPEGDFNSLPPSRVDIRGAMTTYHFPFKNAPFSGEIRTVGLHMNGISTELRVNPPVTVSRGDDLTIVQPVEMMELRSSDDQVPA